MPVLVTYTMYHTRQPCPQKHCHAVSGINNMHLIFKLQATATGACLLILVTRQPQQSLPTDLSQISVDGESKPYCNNCEPYCKKPYCTSLCLEPSFAVPLNRFSYDHTMQSSRLSSIIRHKGATVIEDIRAQMCDVYTGCFINLSAAWAALQRSWVFW